MPRKLLPAVLSLVTILALCAASLPSARARSVSDTTPVPSPVLFIENTGQFPCPAASPCPRFQVRGGTGTVWLTDDALSITVMESTPEVPAGSERGDGATPDASTRTEMQELHGANLRLSFVGSNRAVAPEPFDHLTPHLSYFRGDNPALWRSNVPVWGGVRYRGLYPGLDLEMAGMAAGWGWRFVARPGADLSAVRLRVEGADTIDVDGAAVRLTTAAGTVALPLVQVVAGVGTAEIGALPGAALAGNEIVSPLTTAQASAGRRLRSSAADLLYGTFLGGSTDDYGQDLVVAQSGNLYITGGTLSPDFPTTVGAFDTTCDTDATCDQYQQDLFVARLNPAGNGTADLLYAAFLGGSGRDSAYGIAVDTSGDAYITGMTDSPDLPTTVGAFDTTYDGTTDWPGDAFMLKITMTGEGAADLLYSTFLGGERGDAAMGIAVDQSGNAHIAGYTSSSSFPTTVRAYDRTCGTDGACNFPNTDAFLVKLRPVGVGAEDLLYGTFLGGSRTDVVYGIALDQSGNPYVAGVTYSPDFSTTPGAFDTECGSDGTCNGGYPDAFVVRLDPAARGLADLVYGTFLGGRHAEFGRAIAVDASGNADVTGSTYSSDFPTTVGAFDTTCGTDATCDQYQQDIFVARLNPAGNGPADLLYGSYLGGSSSDVGLGITADQSGDAHVTGYTLSANFPTTAGAFDTACGDDGNCNVGFADAVALHLRPIGDGVADLVHSTFLGGSDAEWGVRIAVDQRGNAYVTGFTCSPNFPTTDGAYDTACGSDGGCDADPHGNCNTYDAFVVELGQQPATPTPTATELATATATATATVTPTPTLTSFPTPGGRWSSHHHLPIIVSP